MIRSFWLAMSIFVVLVGGVLFVPFFGLPALVLAMLSGTVLACMGFIWPSVALQAYRGWNKLAHAYCRLAKLFIEKICFNFVLRIVGLLGSSSNVAGQSAPNSMWIPRVAFPLAAYGNPFAATTGTNRRTKNWMANYCLWAWKTGNQWAVCLIPFLFLLIPLESDKQVHAPDNIYTLF